MANKKASFVLKVPRTMNKTLGNDFDLDFPVSYKPLSTQ